jgi:hypothetical protein
MQFTSLLFSLAQAICRLANNVGNETPNPASAPT